MAMATKPSISAHSSKFTFTVVLDGVEALSDELEEKLVEAGCDDASLLSREHVVCLNFDREAESLSGAVGSAIDDIQAAGYGIATIGISRRAVDDLKAELSAWEQASDEDFEAFEDRLE